MPFAGSILVTGSSGFLGAWIVKDLAERQIPVVLFDRDPDLRRFDQISTKRPSGLVSIEGDITNVEPMRRAIGEHGVTAIVHLAGLQIPVCRENPILGAHVNVGGTLAVFEAARQSAEVRQIVYASSAAVIGPEESYEPGLIPNNAALHPATHYGVFKQCNEGNARVFFQDHGLSSIGLRPWTVYGAGRDLGVTADATRAIKSAVARRPFTIRYGGRNALQYAADVASAFVLCALDSRAVCRTFNLRGDVVPMEDFVAEIESQEPAARGLISLSGGPIPVACDLDDSELHAFLPDLAATPLSEGIRGTREIFARLQRDGRLDLSDL